MLNNEDGVMDFVKMASNDAMKHLLTELSGFSMLSVMDKENIALLDELYLKSIKSRIAELCEDADLTFDVALDMNIKAKEDLQRFLKTYTKV